MKITFVQNDAELYEARGVIDRREPRGVYIMPPGLSGDGTFTVVDNADGNAWTESFKTLDGALIFALGIRNIDTKARWDRPGALKDHGNFV